MIKKVLKIIAGLFFIGLIIVYFLFVTFTGPKSDEEVLKPYKESFIKPTITHQKFRNFEYRKIAIIKDTMLPTMVFVHGTIGSLDNFSAYLNDSVLQQKANMIAYDRVGYNYNDVNHSQESIAFEQALLKDVIGTIKKDKLILIGYSYGGPIALSFKEEVKQIILLAPAVYSAYEVMPWALNFYKWKFTRWLVPYVWEQASKEKMSHKKELQKHEYSWHNTPNKIMSIHGTSDWVVPFKNSHTLQKAFKKDNFKLISIPETGHDLVWTDFETIKQQLIAVLD